MAEAKELDEKNQETRYLIALGANLGDRAANMLRAIQLLSLRIGPVIARSELIETAPLVLPGENPAEHPSYLNAAVALTSAMQPEEVLNQLLAIELELGRTRGINERKWGPRLIDLDLLAADDRVVVSDTLLVPHPEMHRRLFVLEPLLAVAPDWRHPLLGRTVRELYDELTRQIAATDGLEVAP